MYDSSCRDRTDLANRRRPTGQGPMNSAYDVYVYCYSKYGGSGGTRTAQYGIGSTTFSVTQTGTSVSTFPGFRV